MADFNDQEFFDVEPAPKASAVAWRQPKLLAIASAAIVGVVVLAAVGWFAWNMMNTSVAPQGTQRTAEELAAQMLQECEEGDAACANQANANAAREVGDAEACADVSGTMYDECLSVIAFDTGNPELCDDVSDDGQVACKDNAWIKASVDKKDYSLCANIEDADRRGSCEENIGAQAAIANDCAGYNAPVAYCEDQQEIEEVLVAGDPAGCLELSVEGRVNCQELFTVRDDDQDGLTKDREFTLGTSDQMADSDNDGYNDGEEVANGYNPLAP